MSDESRIYDTEWISTLTTATVLRDPLRVVFEDANTPIVMPEVTLTPYSFDIRSVLEYSSMKDITDAEDQKLFDMWDRIASKKYDNKYSRRK